LEVAELIWSRPAEPVAFSWSVEAVRCLSAQLLADADADLLEPLWHRVSKGVVMTAATAAAVSEGSKFRVAFDRAEPADGAGLPEAEAAEEAKAVGSLPLRWTWPLDGAFFLSGSAGGGSLSSSSHGQMLSSVVMAFLVLPEPGPPDADGCGKPRSSGPSGGESLSPPPPTP